MASQAQSGSLVKPGAPSSSITAPRNPQLGLLGPPGHAGDPEMGALSPLALLGVWEVPVSTLVAALGGARKRQGVRQRWGPALAAPVEGAGGVPKKRAKQTQSPATHSPAAWPGRGRHAPGLGRHPLRARGTGSHGLPQCLAQPTPAGFGLGQAPGLSVLQIARTCRARIVSVDSS